MEPTWLNPVSDIVTKALKNSTVNIDKAQGIVECFVAAIGNKDSVGDIIVPGAFSKSLGRRKPRVVWGHNWNEPVGKVLEMFEVGPNDPRLPSKMKSIGVGGLFAKVQFNLASERGREAFSTVAFFGEEQEWSIGYKTIDKEYDAMRQANLLKEVELYEVSPVLHGANQFTGTIAVKVAESMAEEKGGCPVDILSNALSKALEAPVTVQYIEDDTLVYQDTEKNHWASKFQIQNGQFLFGKPYRVILRGVIEPIGRPEPEEVDPNCPCGRHLPPPGHPLYREPKSADSDVETKGIRVLPGGSLQKLQQAIALIQEAITAPVAAPAAQPVERKFKADDYRNYAEKAPGKSFVLGRPVFLSGIIIESSVKDLEHAAKVVDSLSDLLGTVALVVPSVKGFASGTNKIIAYLPKTNSPELFVTHITGTMKELGCDDVESKQLEDCENGKSFEELFLK